MEKSSKLLIPLAAAAALASADNANADGPASAWGPALMGWERGELSDSAKFCEELRNAEGPNIKDYLVDFIPDDRHGIQMVISRKIKIVMEDGEEVTLNCTYQANKNPRDVVVGAMGEIIPVETFSKRLFLPNGPVISFMGTTANAEYTDGNMDGFPDRASFTSTLPGEAYLGDFYDDEMKGQDATTWGVPCVEGQAPDVCEELGVGLDDFDAAVAAGRRALTEIDDE